MSRMFRQSMTEYLKEDVMTAKPQFEFGAAYNRDPHNPGKLIQVWFGAGEKESVSFPPNITADYLIHYHPTLPGAFASQPSLKDSALASVWYIKNKTRNYIIDGHTGKTYETMPRGSTPARINFVELEDPTPRRRSLLGNSRHDPLGLAEEGRAGINP